MWTKSVIPNTGYNVEQVVPLELFPNEHVASGAVLLAPSGEPSAGGYQLPASVAVTVRRTPRASRGVTGMSMWRSIVSSIAVVIATGARWSVRWFRALASGDEIFCSLYLARTAFPSAAESSKPCVPDFPAQASPRMVALLHGRPPAIPET
jgi:hypothetical protein